MSIIVPCFNSGNFLLEALASCFQSTYRDFEILIIDDGSTEIHTLEILTEVQNKYGLGVIFKSNGGPASARNLGARNAKGEFLFFLDSDNLIRPDYLTKALKAIQNDPMVGIVYSKPRFFGLNALSSTRFESKPYNFDSLLEGNYIDMCSLVRSSAFWEVGGFDEHRDLIGWEDVDLWIRLAQTHWRFGFLDEILFEYRVREDSLMGNVDSERRERMLRYLGAKHGFIIHQRYRQYFRLIEKIQAKPFSFFLRILYYKYILRKKLLD